MKASLWLVLLLMTGLPAAPALQQVPGPQKSDEGEPGSIRGRVTAADTGKPLRRARVRVISDARDAFTRPVTANTNSRGEFEVTGLPEGSYFVTGSRAGFTDVQYGQRRPLERGLAVPVRAGQPTDRIDLALPGAGVLTGRITDELGEPYPGVRVDALGLRYRNGSRQPSVAGVATTDDLGHFRISGLQPGSYYVVATSTETWRNEKQETLGYASTYYPGGPVDQAQLVALGPAEQRSDLFISLQAGRTARISGRVVRATGEPAAGAGVSIAYSYPGVIMSAGMRSVRAAADGSFQIRDVPGGVYRVMSGGDDAELAINDADVEGVVLTHRVGSTVSGTVVTDEGTPPPFPVSGVRVLIETSSDKVLPTVRVVQVGTDWSFTMKNLGGPFMFRIIGIPDEWMMASATLGESDIADEPFDVPTGGKDIAGAKIVVTRKVGRISGTVLDADGRATSAASVIVFSDDSKHWIPYSRFVRTTRPGSDGRFSLSHLPAGTYRAAALDYVEQGRHEDAAFLAELLDIATTFALGEGAASELTLTLRAR